MVVRTCGLHDLRPLLRSGRRSMIAGSRTGSNRTLFNREVIYRILMGGLFLDGVRINGDRVVEEWILHDGVFLSLSKG